MVEQLLRPFYEVMCKYTKRFSELGVRANLSTWETNKSILLSLLRRHPDWDEGALAVEIGRAHV